MFLPLEFEVILVVPDKKEVLIIIFNGRFVAAVVHLWAYVRRKKVSKMRSCFSKFMV